MRTHRQVGWDDFIAAGEWLVANGVTTRERLGILGVSGGGMLVGGVLVQRPDLFGAAVPIAGVLDLLRFQLFGEGAGWQGDLGSPDEEVEFHSLYKLSPLHNVRDGTRYPATLIVTSDHDVRVALLHSYKFAAALQHAQAGPAPILLKVETRTGHGLGSTLDLRDIAAHGHRRLPRQEPGAATRGPASLSLSGVRLPVTNALLVTRISWSPKLPGTSS